MRAWYAGCVGDPTERYPRTPKHTRTPAYPLARTHLRIYPHHNTTQPCCDTALRNSSLTLHHIPQQHLQSSQIFTAPQTRRNGAAETIVVQTPDKTARGLAVIVVNILTPTQTHTSTHTTTQHNPAVTPRSATYRRPCSQSLACALHHAAIARTKMLTSCCFLDWQEWCR